MQTMQEDSALVELARGGDRDAFAQIYDRYADRLHDYCNSMLRNRHDAADATQDTFVAAVQRMGQLRDPSKLRAWLYAIARNECIRRSKRRAKTVPREDMSEITAPAAGLDAELGTGDLGPDELAALVWDAAAGLAERDRTMLDLHLRQGLDGQELAEAVGMAPSRVYVIMSRLRDQMERALGALLVARVGRKDCRDLDAILTGWDGRLTPLIRKRVARHIEDCEVCSERRRTLVSPLALLGAVPLVPAPLALRDRVLQHVSSTEPVAGRGVGRAAKRLERGARTRSLILGGSAVAATVAVATLVTSLVAGGSPATGPARATTELTTATTVPASTLPRTGGEPDPGGDRDGKRGDDDATTTSSPPTTSDRRTTTTSAGKPPPPPTPPSTIATWPPPGILGLSGPDLVCSTHSFQVSTTVQGGTPPVVVRIIWWDTANVIHNTATTRSGDTYTATLGPLNALGQARWRVFAADADGREVHSAQVPAIESVYCPG